jgi:hypothetical protein
MSNTQVLSAPEDRASAVLHGAPKGLAFEEGRQIHTKYSGDVRIEA